MRNLTNKALKHSVLIISCIIFSFLFRWWLLGKINLQSTLVFFILFYLMILVITRIGSVFFKKNSEMSLSEIKRKMVPNFLIFISISLAFFLILLLATSFLNLVIYNYDYDSFIYQLFRIELPWGAFVFLVVISIVSVFLFYNIWIQAIERERQLRETNLIYKFKTLKAQVQPHFLFNSFNTLSELIYTDEKKADQYLQKLSGIYRYILDNEEANFVQLNEELGFVRQYFDLQKERDGDKIILTMDIEDAEKYKIVPVSLQILVENALKHNIASEKTPLCINIHKANNNIVVSNNLQKKNIISSSHETGLSNLKERVRLVIGKELKVIEENGLFLVELPIAKNSNESTNY